MKFNALQLDSAAYVQNYRSNVEIKFSSEKIVLQKYKKEEHKTIFLYIFHYLFQELNKPPNTLTAALRLALIFFRNYSKINILIISV